MLDQNDIQILMQLMNQQMEQQFAKFKVELKTELKTELKAELKAELIPELKATLIPELKAELVPAIKTDLKNELVPEIMHGVKVLMESYFDPKFQALSEEVRMIHEVLIPPQQLEEAESRIDVLEGVVRLHSREIEALKLAR